MDSMRASLNTFIDVSKLDARLRTWLSGISQVGVPTIRFAQDQAAAGLLNMSTVVCYIVFWIVSVSDRYRFVGLTGHLF
jgi:hypothetical protein